LILSPTPKYVLRVQPLRVMLPKLVIIAAFGIIFLIIVAVNGFLFPDQVQFATYAIVWISALLLLALEAAWTYVRYHNFRYDFFENEILVRGFTTYAINYSEVTDLSVQKTFYDRFTKTQTLLLQDGKHQYQLRNVPNDPQIIAYVSQMINIGKQRAPPL